MDRMQIVSIRWLGVQPILFLHESKAIKCVIHYKQLSMVIWFLNESAHFCLDFDRLLFADMLIKDVI